jgi:hypothetical protein
MDWLYLAIVLACFVVTWAFLMLLERLAEG